MGCHLSQMPRCSFRISKPIDKTALGDYLEKQEMIFEVALGRHEVDIDAGRVGAMDQGASNIV